MSVIASDLADYLALRRAIGYKLVDDGRQLAQFVAYLDASDTATVTVATALDWATGTTSAGNGARRLSVVRGFARYLQAVDPAHEVPPVGLLPEPHDPTGPASVFRRRDHCVDERSEGARSAGVGGDRRDRDWFAVGDGDARW